MLTRIVGVLGVVTASTPALLSQESTPPEPKVEIRSFAPVASSTLELDRHWPPRLAQYVPEGQTYDPEFPKPEDILGWPVGTWHVRHDQLVDWFETCAEASPRMTLQRYGRTHEARPLLLSIVTSPANHARLEEIRAAHVEAVRTGADSHDGPSIVWMGYGVHGNESSASNASLLLAYHLAAATGPEIEAFLEKTVVLIDPCINPDGGARFAHWANMHRGTNLSVEPAHRDHDEEWPGGRTNHYWFDLNRDWLLLTHPESRGRIRQFQRWLPTVLTDYHEMGSGSSYFFQPGIPSRRNPMTPESNHALTAEIATYHARALDAMGSEYFTEERFDDFYYGKGSTYPDIHGAIGILFEQASSRGHVVKTDRGELSFPFTIKNQFTTSLSTLRAVGEMADRLGAHQRAFYRDALADAASAEIGGWVFGDEHDSARALEMAKRLRWHGIEVHALRGPFQLPAGTTFPGGYAFTVPADQPQYRLIRALFDTRTSWDDNTFYDVSAWAFPLSFDVALTPVARGDWSSLKPGLPLDAVTLLEDVPLPAANTVAYAFEPYGADSGRALHHLQKAGLRARVATKPFRADVDRSSRAFPIGSIVVPVGAQGLSAARVHEAVMEVQRAGWATPWPLSSGLTPDGPDLGSGSFAALETPNLALVVGGRVSSYEAGEMWHELDTRVGMAVTLLEAADGVRASTLEPFTHLILVNGATSAWDDGDQASVASWVRGGGVLIATKGSAVWAARELLRKADPMAVEPSKGTEKPPGPLAPIPYGDYEALRAEQRIAGTIFEAHIDRTHPLGYGFTRDQVPVFRNFEETLPEGNDPFSAPLRYTDEPLLSGFASASSVERIASTPAIRAERVGSGTVIAMIDDPVFRGVWYGTRRLLLNAIFFGQAIERRGPIEDRTEEDEAAYDHGHALGR
ncbi:M14 family zinc carboxypeptidase [Saltatorellus ferox]